MSDVFAFGPFLLCPRTRTLHKEGALVPVGSRAFDILAALVERNGEVLTRRDLMEIAWPRLVVEESNVRVQMANLRRTLGCGDAGMRYIASVAGRGYCFVAAVERTRTHPLPEAAPQSRPASAFPPPLAGALGREECVEELARIVLDRRLVTIVGAAGAGKTTLAILVAHALEAFKGSTFFVDLADVEDEGMVAEALASAVGYTPSEGPLFPGLLGVLSAGPTLIVLDNCEHLIAAVASLCQRIIEGTGHVTLLNTSREALRINEEFVYLLRPLASPPNTGRLSATQAMVWPAVQLFMARAYEGGARGPLSDDDAPTVAALCRRLDGNPHAIGLVASRVGAYGIPGVWELFESQFALHWQGRRDAIARHQTVEALIDWSHNLLPERDRLVLYRLSVFSGAFSIEAAAAVASDDRIDPLQVGDAVGDLVDKSLVAVSLANGEPQMRLLETTKAYAAARLARVHGGEQVARRHAVHYAQQLRRHADGHPFTAPASAAPRIQDLGNVRAAIDWAFARDPSLAAEISCLAAPQFLEQGLIRECTRICERALDLLPDQLRSTTIELGLLDAAAISYYSGGDYGLMPQAIERGLDVARQLDDTRSAFRFLSGLHLAMMANGRFLESLAVSARYAAMAANHGGQSEAMIAGWMDGSSRHYLGDQAAADASYTASSELAVHHVPRPLHYFETKEKIVASIGKCRVKWALGLPKRALQLAGSAIEEARSHPDSLYLSVTLCFPILLDHGLYDRAEALIGELDSVAIDYKVAVRRQVIHVLKGHLLLHRGRHEEAIQQLEACLAMLSPPKMSVVRTDALQALAQAQRASGDGRSALASIDEAIELATETRGEFNLADLLRTKAQVMLDLPQVRKEEVDDVLSQAMASAREQSALALELRVALAIAQLRASEGKKEEATKVLEPVYARFIEGFDTNDLKAAAHTLKSLLA